ncbi:NAD(P)-binding protein [Pseudovirgaria hyperparasitica]|uniref:NAD(P)-binding protein n=1 Tax=Pseudovirgaria hyperparasitica TaxID=470096 RepID=A0A6A6WJ92_9PEZI|nr:NAD(P)-binding protein [Pseudovirgaria hyperparasitica]KAF2762469.1 NAD(P)-binding protein [Pseudovirgaria hyperparasitica]
MPVMHIAVSGYGAFARYIVSEITAAGHTAIVLTRSLKENLTSDGIEQHVTDYSVESLTSALNNCDALISTISELTTANIEIHANMLAACQASSKCKRFIPPEFAANIRDYPDQPGFYYETHEPVRQMLRDQTDVEWSLVCLGWFADYFVPAKNRYIKDIGNLHPMDWSNKRFLIAGSGNEPIDLTWARDAAKGLVALTEAQRGTWEAYTFMSGERSSWNAAVAHVRHSADGWQNAPLEHISLRSVVESVRSTNDDKVLESADYHLLSISGACALPLDAVRAHKDKFFSGIRFRSLEEGLLEVNRAPNAII